MPSQPNFDFPTLQRGGSLILAWRVKNEKVLIVGGGVVAASRVVHAVQADAQVTVVSPKDELCEEMQFRIDEGSVLWREGRFVEEDLYDVTMVLAEDVPEAAQIYEMCKSKKIPVNVADVLTQCDFWFMSTYRDGPLQIAVSSNGMAPRLANRIRKDLGNSLPPNIGRAISRFGLLRKAIRKRDPDPKSAPKRMRWLSNLADSWSIAKLSNMDDQVIQDIVNYYDDDELPKEKEGEKGKGKVFLVGGGPGNVNLLTVEAKNQIINADLVVADRLISNEIIELVKDPNKKLKVAPPKTKVTSGSIQDELNSIVLEGLDQGLHVVRLKVGDPLLYGRAGEEMEFFKERGYDPIIIPGISSAISAAAAANIPLTHRGLSDQLIITTGHSAGGQPMPTLPFYTPNRTLIILMAASKSEELQIYLSSLNYPSDLPCTYIESYSLPNQKITHTSLVNLAIDSSNVQPPATLYIGHTSNFSI